MKGTTRYTSVVPGFGSRINTLLRDQSDGLLPVQQSQGPHLQPRLAPDLELHHVELFEDLVISLYDFTDHDHIALRGHLQTVISRHAVSWSQTLITLNHVAESLVDDVLHDAIFTGDEIRAVLHILQDPATWPFLLDNQVEQASFEHTHDLQTYEAWCSDLATHPAPWIRTSTSCPRVF